uniref:Nuclear receptor domain-containing protein n=1 Tax=Meloidogyne javanica TaxID=6303 RepID=A0A915M3H7_MELJA
MTGARNNTNQVNPDYSTIIAGEEVLLCKVCSDRASGFHYGIFSCEGCKGFFRRSLQNKIDYRPCTQSQKCQIVRANRNRCQECSNKLCLLAKAVVRFAENIGGFRLLRIDDQAQVLKESLYPVLLLRFCSLRLFPNNDRLFDLANIPLALLLPTSSFSALRDCTVELIIRIRAARRPTDLPLSDKELAMCAAVCLCRLEGAGECASGGATSTASFNGMTANTFIDAWDEQSDQLGQAVCRRIREKFSSLLNYSLNVSGQSIPFGPTSLRTDLLVKNNSFNLSIKSKILAHSTPDQ